MPVYFEYALKVSLCLAVTFFFYATLLKRMTYFIWNRYYLLLSSILCFIIPFINIQVVQLHPPDAISFFQLPVAKTSLTLVYGRKPETFSYWQLFSALYLFVNSMLFIRLLVQLLSINNLKSKAILRHAGKVKVYHLQEPVRPFSFLNSIFVNHDHYNEHELHEIIHHEQIHVQQKHTLDVLITEIICILNWYNPFAWFIKKAVRENLEFIADNALLNKGVNKKEYQYLLLKVNGSMPCSVAIQFKFFSLKNRINMMNRIKTSRFQLLKFALLIPVLSLLLVAFGRRQKAMPVYAKIITPQTETYTLSTLTYSIADERVKTIVMKEQDKCLLKVGQLLNLELVYNEKSRLQSLLQKNGYTNLKPNAIRFMIDTASVNNSFSVEININAEPSGVAARINNLMPANREMLIPNFSTTEKPNRENRFSFIKQAQVFNMQAYLLTAPNISLS